MLCFFTKFSANKESLSTIATSSSMAYLKINKEFTPIFILVISATHFNTNDNGAQEEDETNAYLIRETCEKIVLDVVSKLIMTCVNCGDELSLDAWKNINVPLHATLQETLTNDNHNNDDEVQQQLSLQNAKQKAFIKMCNNVSKSLLSLEQQTKIQRLKVKEQNNQQKSKMTWNVEMNNGMSKFMLFLKKIVCVDAILIYYLVC